MLHAMKTELMLRKGELQNKTLQSLYFGGGTPSILSADEIHSLIDETLKYFSFENDIEITLEANPDDLNQQFLKQLAGTPVNRLSIGTQSFFEEDLKLMNRAHTASEAGCNAPVPLPPRQHIQPLDSSGRTPHPPENAVAPQDLPARARPQ